jgi:hypothetical protein
MMTPTTNAEAQRNATTRKARIAPDDVHAFVEKLFLEDMHARRVLSLANGVVGVIHAAALSVHAIGHGLALAQGGSSKHAIKQADRLLSNEKLDVWEHFAQWVPFVIASRKEIVVALDWTEFDADDHVTIALYLITSHGRATPLMWKTHPKSTLEGHRSAHENELIDRFVDIVDPELAVTLLADRGFGDQVFYARLQASHIDFVIRFRECILVTTADGETGPASDFVPPNGRTRKLDDALVTSDKTPIGAVVCVKAARMKDSWCLATSLKESNAAEIVKLYGRRFTIEETFRDQKDMHFGMGLKATHIGKPERRDRILLLSALAQTLLTMLGAAAEETGLDRLMKANTVKRRTHSLFRQGCYWYAAIPAMREDRFELLMNAFAKMVSAHTALTQIFGVI